MLIVRNLGKRIQRTDIFKEISFEAEAGEFIVVLGPSGSGKSMLLRCLGLKQKWEEGTIIYDGIDMAKASWLQRMKRKKDFAVMDSSPQLPGESTAYRNVIRGRSHAFPLWRRLVGDKASEEEHMRAMDYLEAVGLLDKARSKVKHLSGGEQQRVALAKALNHGARVLVADEPVSNLDPHAALEVVKSLRRLCDRDQIIVICTLQNIEMAERVGTRFLGLKEGRLVFDAKGRRLTAREKSLISV